MATGEVREITTLKLGEANVDVFGLWQETDRLVRRSERPAPSGGLIQFI